MCLREDEFENFSFFFSFTGSRFALRRGLCVFGPCLMEASKAKPAVSLGHLFRAYLNEDDSFEGAEVRKGGVGGAAVPTSSQQEPYKPPAMEPVPEVIPNSSCQEKKTEREKKKGGKEAKRETEAFIQSFPLPLFFKNLHKKKKKNHTHTKRMLFFTADM